MVVLITQKVPASLRGELSRWMIEPRTGVFVGQVSAMVRDRLWDLAVKGAKDGGVILLWSSPTEQGFQWRIYGETGRQLSDFEGLSLVHIPHGALKGKKRSSLLDSSSKEEQTEICPKQTDREEEKPHDSIE
jgi:CRISPR-associated protein Cas2